MAGPDLVHHVSRFLEAAGLPMGDLQSHGGYEVPSPEGPVVHVIGHGESIELIVAAGRLPDDQAWDPHDESAGAGTAEERSSVWMDWKTRLVFLSRLVPGDCLDDNTFGRAVRELARSAVFWQAALSAGAQPCE